MKTIIFFLLLIPLLCTAQADSKNNALIDSLKLVVETAEHDTTRIQSWQQWVNLVIQGDPEQALELNRKVEKLCLNLLEEPEVISSEQELNIYRKSLANAVRLIGAIHMFRGNYSDASAQLSRSLVMMEEIGDEARIGQIQGYFGWIFYSQGEYDKAIDAYTQSLKIAEELDIQKRIPNMLNAIGKIYAKQGEYDGAMDYYTRSLNMAEKFENKFAIGTALEYIGDIQIKRGDFANAIEYHTRNLKIQEDEGDNYRIAGALYSISQIYFTQQDYDKAMEYLESSLKIYDEIKNTRGVAFNLLAIGNIHYEKGNAEQAIEYYSRSLKIYEEIGEKNMIATCLNQIGTYHKDQKQYKEAMDFYNKSLSIFQEIGNKDDMASILIDIGNIFQERGNFNQAINYGQQALGKAKEIGTIKDTRDAAHSLYESYKKVGKSQLALQMHETYIFARDSLESEANQKGVIRQEYKYAYEKQALADSIQNAEIQKIQHAQLIAEKAENQKARQQTYFLLGGLALSLLFGGFIFKQKKEVESEKDKSEHLLLNILPKATAEELKEKGSVSAQSFDTATVLFTDFKDFSSHSENMTPKQLVTEIDHCFSAFDQITQQFNIEKIKTMGDAYMAAGGLPLYKPTHALDTIYAAIAIRDFMLQRVKEQKKLNQPCFEIRIGIHSGPLIAGVVGVKKFQYDIWGDSVNIANRMESACEVGMVNISESTYQLVKEEPSLSFISRGKISVKGKGEMEMYFVQKKS